MKKIYKYIGILALASFAAGCAKEELVDPNEFAGTEQGTVVAGEELTFTLSVPASAQTKTVLGAKNGDTYPVYWSEGDVVTLNGTAATEFIPSSDNTAATAKFKLASLAAPFNFLYGGVSGTSNQVSFPSTQNYVEGSFDPAAMPMYASVNSVKENVTFSHVASLLKFSFTGTNQINSINLSAGDAALAGNFTIGTTDGVLDGTLTSGAANSNLVYNLGGDKQLSQTPFVFYVAVPAGTYAEGITLEIIDNDSGHMTVKVMNTEESNTIAAGKVREFENVVYTPTKELNLIQINSEATLQQFATRVAAGETTLNARVIADFTVSSSWTPVEDYKGIFDGNSKTISGLDQPLFNVLGGVVKNLTLNSNIIATDADDRNWGMFAKQLYPSVDVDDVAGLQNCTAKGSLTYTPSSALSADCQVGGLLGNNKGGAVSNCTNEATVTVGDNGETNASQTSVGGVVGRTQKGGDLSTQGDISNCTNNGTVVCNAQLSENVYIGGVLGYQVEKKEYISDCVNNGLVKLGSTFSTSGAVQLGGVIGMGKGAIESCTNSANAVVTSEAGATGGSYLAHGGVVGRLNRESGTYSGLTNAGTINVGMNGADAWVGGIVGRCNEGATLSEVTNIGTINYTAESTKAAYIGGIAGRITQSLSYCHTKGGSINYSGTNTSGALYIGGITGYTKEAITISNCSSAMALNVGGEFSSASDNYFGFGGIIGNVANDGGVLSDCTNIGDITLSQQLSNKGYTFLAGVVGRCQGSISGCSNSGTVSFTGKNSAQNPYIGGIVGTNSNVAGDRISNCTNNGNIVVNAPDQSNKYVYVAGIAGRSYGGVTATNNGNIDIQDLTCTLIYGGGLVGWAENGSITGTNTGNYTIAEGCQGKDNIVVGGIVGQSKAPITSCTNSGTISNAGNAVNKDKFVNIGGVAGYNYTDGVMTDCINTGDVINSGNSEQGYVLIGGVTSEGDQDIINCVNKGKISNSGASGNNRRVAVGGIAGTAYSDITSSHNEGEIYNNGAGAGNITIAGIAGLSQTLTLTDCYNTGYVYNEGAANAGILVGGVAGLSDGCTFVTCYNTGEVENYGAANDISNDKNYGKDGGYSDFAVDVCLGGIAGFLVNENTLTGTETEYNYNSGLIYEESASKWVAMGGIAGCTKAGVSDLSYTKNLSGGVYIKGSLRNKTYLGGVLGCAGDAVTMDYASNAATITYRSVTIEAFCLTGGVIGGWYSGVKSVSSTITGCTNSGMIDCSNAGGNGSNMAAASGGVTDFSYVGGICGVGNCTNKKFINCTNTGRIAVYNQVKTRLGGILGYSNVNPDGCVNTGRINYCRWNTAGNGGNGQIGGVVGYMNIATVSNITNDASVKSTGSTPNCFTGGLIGQVGDSTNAFLNCNVGTTGNDKTISGAAENSFGSTSAGLFASDGTANAWDFTGCKIKNGAVCSKITVTEDNLADAIIGRQHATSITNAPTFVDSF